MKDSTVFDKPAYKMTMGCYLKRFTMKTFVEAQILQYPRGTLYNPLVNNDELTMLLNVLLLVN